MVHKPKVQFPKSLKISDPTGNRTPVSGVRGRNVIGADMPKQPVKQWVIGDIIWL